MADEPERWNEAGAEAGNEDGDGGDIGETGQPMNQAAVQALAKQLIQALGGANPAAGEESSGSTNTHTGENLY